VRHVIEALVAERSPYFDRAGLEENVRMRAKFGIDDEKEVVLHEYACALMHADGSSNGKIYITRQLICFSGSLFGRETRAIFGVADIVTVERAESPAPNTLVVTSSTTEEKFTFLLDSTRAHALALLQQLIAIVHSDHSLLAPRRLPTQGLELPPEPILEKAKAPLQPFAQRSLALSPSCLIVASGWRYPVRASLMTPDDL